MLVLDEIHITVLILYKYVLTEVLISPAAHTMSPHLIHPHPSQGSYGSFLLAFFTFFCSTKLPLTGAGTLLQDCHHACSMNEPGRSCCTNGVARELLL